MKVFKYMLVLLSLLFVSCNLGTITKQEEVNEEKTGGVGVEAHIYIPNWNAPKVTGARIIDPYSTTINLYRDFGSTLVDTISFTPSGGVEVLSFTGLEVGTYDPGELVINIYDGLNELLTTGENLESVSLTPVGSNAIVFSSIPASPIVVSTLDSVAAQSLIDDDHVFISMSVVEGEIYELIYERTSSVGDVDLYLFDEIGRSITSDVVMEGQYDPQKFVFVPESTGTYYMAFHAYMGAGDVSFTYDLNHSPDNGTLAVSGTLHFPSAVAGTAVYIKATHSYIESIVIKKEIARDGDTTLDYVITGFPTDTNVSIFAVVDYDGSSTVENVHGTQGDITGSYEEVFDIGINHARGIDVYLDEIFGVYGTVNFPDWVYDGTRIYVAKVYANGELTGSFGGYSSYSGPWSSEDYSTIAHPGTYRILYIADRDNSGSGASLSNSNFYDVVTGGDYYYLSEEFTVSNSNVTLLSGTAYTASIVTGTVVLPEQKSLFYYRVFADDNPDVTDGVISTFSDYYYDGGIYVDYFNYSLVVPEGAAIYIGAHVYSGYYDYELTPDDYYSYLDAENPGIYYDGDYIGDLYLDNHVNILTGTFQLPPGIYADGYQFTVGNITQDIWIDGVVPPGTGSGGSFEYSLEGFELGEDQEIALVVDMDVNGLENSPNAGDIVGYFDEVVLDNPLGQTLNFVETIIADPRVYGSVGFPEYVSNKNYQIWIDGEPEEDGNVTGSSMNYDLLFVEAGTHSITFVIDNNEDGIFGNRGDFLGRTDVYVDTVDTTAPGITLDELGIVVEGEITLPDDLGVDVDIYVILDSTTGGAQYEFYHYFMPDEDLYPDVIPYRFENVAEDLYTLNIFVDINGNATLDMGDLLAYYPYGMTYELEEIDIHRDIFDLNYVVDPSAAY